MNTGNIITCKDNSKYKVIKELKSGGQGSVYIVESVNKTPESYALKIINEKNDKIKSKKIENIKQIKEDSALFKNSLNNKRFNIALPISLYEKNGEFGYVMNLCSGKDIGDLMIEKKFDSMKLEKRLNLVNQIAESAAWLRSLGYCYQDFSHGNFLYDEKNDVVSIIDVDNLTPSSSASSGERCFAKGTSFYIAPEVAFGQCNPSIESDNFALATLFFKIMTGSTNSPYHGKELYSKDITPGDMLDAAFYTSDDPDYGYDWLTFVFDPKNKINEIDLTGNDKKFIEEGKRIISNWNKVPNEMKELFYKAFKNPLDAMSRKKRPTSRDWMNVTETNKINNKGFVSNSIPVKETPKPQPTQIINALRLSLPDRKTVDIMDEFKVSTTRGFSFGIVKKVEDDYIFTSNTMYVLKSKLENKYTNIMPGENITLQQGMEIYFSTNYDERIKVISIK